MGFAELFDKYFSMIRKNVSSIVYRKSKGCTPTYNMDISVSPGMVISYEYDAEHSCNGKLKVLSHCRVIAEYSGLLAEDRQLLRAIRREVLQRNEGGSNVLVIKDKGTLQDIILAVKKVEIPSIDYAVAASANE